ncbi:hypothetical protein A2U01_0108898, partial [Trifolium medium]|nr:hypothetical protein [Trifolium medium]
MRSGELGHERPWRAREREEHEELEIMKKTLNR